MKSGITLVEVLLSIVIFAAASASVLAVVSGDLSNVTQRRYDLIARMAAREQLEAQAKLGGYDVLFALPAQSTFTHPKLALLPCAVGKQFVDPALYGFAGRKALRYAAVVEVADLCDASGTPLPTARLRRWQLATIVDREGFDRTP